MTITALNIVNCKTPFMNMKSLEQLTGYKSRTISERVKELRQHEDRYGEHSVIGENKSTIVNVCAFLDFMKYRNRLKDSNMKKFVPEYDPERIAREIGLYDVGKDA